MKNEKLLQELQQKQESFLTTCRKRVEKQEKWTASDWIEDATQKIKNINPEPVDFHDYDENGKIQEPKSIYYQRIVKNVLAFIQEATESEFCLTSIPERLGKLFGCLVFWNGRQWFRLDGDQIAGIKVKKLITTAATRLGIDDETSEASFFIDGLLKELRLLLPPIGKPNNEFGWLNFTNGTLRIDIKTANTTFLPHDKTNYLTHMLPYDYDPKAIAPLFDEFLLRVLPRETTRAALMEFLGSCFLPGRGSGKIMLALGTPSGDNGKSTLIRILEQVLGRENVTNYSLTELSRKETVRYNITGKLLNWGDELGTNFDAENIKKMAGGEPVIVRQMYEQPSESDRYARLAGNVNELPSTNEITESFFKRLLVIPFLEMIPKEKQDPGLAARICETERCGILNQILRGTYRLIQNNYQIETPETTTARQAYRAELNPVVAWVEAVSLEEIFREEVLDEWGHPTGETRSVSLLTAAELYRKFIHWAETSDPTAAKMSQTKFGRLAQMLPLQKERSCQFGNRIVYRLFN